MVKKIIMILGLSTFLLASENYLDYLKKTDQLVIKDINNLNYDNLEEMKISDVRTFSNKVFNKNAKQTLIMVIDPLCPACLLKIRNIDSFNYNVNIVFYPLVEIHPKSPEIIKWLSLVNNSKLIEYSNKAIEDSLFYSKLMDDNNTIDLLNTTFNTKVDKSIKLPEMWQNFYAIYPIKGTPTLFKTKD